MKKQLPVVEFEYDPAYTGADPWIMSFVYPYKGAPLLVKGNLHKVVNYTLHKHPVSFVVSLVYNKGKYTTEVDFLGLAAGCTIKASQKPVLHLSTGARIYPKKKWILTFIGPMRPVEELHLRELPRCWPKQATGYIDERILNTLEL